jgi:hypothetical protein
MGQGADEAVEARIEVTAAESCKHHYSNLKMQLTNT